MLGHRDGQNRILVDGFHAGRDVVHRLAVFIDKGIVIALAEEVQLKLRRALLVADQAEVPVFAASARGVDIFARLAGQQLGLIPLGREILEEVAGGAVEISLRTVSKALDAALIGDRQSAHLCDGHLFARVGAVREHRRIVRRPNCTAHERQHAVVVSAHIGGTEKVLLCAEDSFTAEGVRIGPALAGGLICAVDVDKHMVFRCELHQADIELDIILGLGIEEVRFNALEAHVRQLFDAALRFVALLQIVVVLPGDQADALFIGVADQILGPIVIAVISEFAVALAAAARLPAFVQEQVFPAHFGGKIDVFLINVRVAGGFAVQPCPGSDAGLDPGGVLQHIGRAQVLRHCIFSNVCTGADDGETPRGRKRGGGVDSRSLLVGEYNVEAAVRVADDVRAAIFAVQARFGNQSIFTSGRLVQQRHAVPLIELGKLFFFFHLLVVVDIRHDICRGTLRDLQGGIFRGNRDGRAFIFRCDLILKGNAVVIGAHDNAESDALDAFLRKVERGLVRMVFHLRHLGADQLIRIVDLLVDAVDKAQLREIAQAGGQPHIGVVHNQVVVLKGSIGDLPIMQGKESRNTAVRRCDLPGRGRVALADDEIHGGLADNIPLRQSAGDGHNAVRNACHNAFRGYGRNAVIGARVSSAERIRGDHGAADGISHRGQLRGLSDWQNRLLCRDCCGIQGGLDLTVAEDLGVAPEAVVADGGAVCAIVGLQGQGLGAFGDLDIHELLRFEPRKIIDVVFFYTVNFHGEPTLAIFAVI